jgi:hypothetical protein
LSTYLLFFISTHAKCLLFCSLFSDNENPKEDAATAPLVDAPAIDELPSQEAAVVDKSPEAAVKKAASRASKCLKRAPVASISLDAHRPMSSADDVSTTFLWLTLFTALKCSSHVLLLTDFDEKVRLFGH